MVPTGMLPIGMALPGLMSTCSPDTTLSPDGEALRRQDVGLLAVADSVTSAMKAVRFGSYSIRSTVRRLAGVLAALEVDVAVGALVAAAAEAHGDAAEIVAAAGRASCPRSAP